MILPLASACISVFVQYISLIITSSVYIHFKPDLETHFYTILKMLAPAALLKLKSKLEAIYFPCSTHFIKLLEADRP